MGCLAAGEFGVVPASGLDAGEALLAWDIDEDEDVAGGVEAVFEEEWDVFDEEGGAGLVGVGERGGASLTDEGMDEMFEFFSIRCVFEDAGGDFGAVEVGLGVEDVFGPPGGEGVFDVVRGEELSDLLVGVEDGGAEFGEDLGDGGLAGADAS